MWRVAEAAHCYSGAIATILPDSDALHFRPHPSMRNLRHRVDVRPFFLRYSFVPSSLDLLPQLYKVRSRFLCGGKTLLDDKVTTLQLEDLCTLVNGLTMQVQPPQQGNQLLAGRCVVAVASSLAGGFAVACCLVCPWCLVGGAGVHVLGSRLCSALRFPVASAPFLLVWRSVPVFSGVGLAMWPRLAFS